MKMVKIFFIAFAGVIFSTAAMAQTAETDPTKVNVKEVTQSEMVAPEVSDTRMVEEAAPAADIAPAGDVTSEEKDKVKNKKGAKKGCCSKDKEKAASGCEKKD